MGEMLNEFQTRIGTIIQAEKISSLTGARDVGGAIVTASGRIVIAAGISDGELNYPYSIVVSDDGGITVREVFSMPAGEKLTYHTTGLAYDEEHHVVISMIGRNNGYQLADRPFGNPLPFSMDGCGDNEAIVVLSWDDGETWEITETVPLEKPENTAGIYGTGVQVGGEIFFAHSVGTGNPEGTARRIQVQLACIRVKPVGDGTFGCDYDHKFRTLSTNHDKDIQYSDETEYIANVDGSGYLSFTRCNFGGPPYRREYDLDHRPTCDFERVRVIGFDKRDYDPGENGPKLIAFGIVRMMDGNLLYASRYYGTDHHRAGNILMTSRDDGRTWLFEDEYVPRSLAPLEFPNSGGGGNPSLVYAPDGTFVHLTSEGLANNCRVTSEGHVCLDPPPHGGYFICRFEGFKIEGATAGNDGHGTISIDVSHTTGIDDVYISTISVVQSEGVEMPNEYTDRYSYNAERTRVSFSYEMTGSDAFIQPRIVLANRNNPYRPTFIPRINVDRVATANP